MPPEPNCALRECNVRARACLYPGEAKPGSGEGPAKKISEKRSDAGPNPPRELAEKMLKESSGIMMWRAHSFVPCRDRLEHPRLSKYSQSKRRDESRIVARMSAWPHWNNAEFHRISAVSACKRFRLTSSAPWSNRVGLGDRQRVGDFGCDHLTPAAITFSIQIRGIGSNLIYGQYARAQTSTKSTRLLSAGRCGAVRKQLGHD